GRGALHDLSAVADQRLVQELDCAVRKPDRDEDAGLRLARPLLRGQPEPGHFGSHDGAVQEGRLAGAADQVVTLTRKPVEPDVNFLFTVSFHAASAAFAVVTHDRKQAAPPRG